MTPFRHDTFPGWQIALVQFHVFRDPTYISIIVSIPQRSFKPPLSRVLYNARNLMERLFNKLKHSKAMATRCDKRDYNYPASIRIRLRRNQAVA
jgi:transposase